MKSILVSGVAFFIYSKVSRTLLAEEYKFTGVDNLNDFYDVLIWGFSNYSLIAFEASKCEYIALLDQDDLLVKDRDYWLKGNLFNLKALIRLLSTF